MAGATLALILCECHINGSKVRVIFRDKKPKMWTEEGTERV
jgi:hypothetical protein